MTKYIDAEKLIAEIERLAKTYQDSIWRTVKGETAKDFRDKLLSFITSIQQEQPNNIIQWAGNNLKEVIDFTGKSPRFGEWFKSWEDYENYVHSHNGILKLFSEDGSHYEVPVGAWIVKTPDGYNVPSVVRFIPAKQEQPEVDLDREIIKYKVPFTDESEYLNETTLDAIAHHFAEWEAIHLSTRKEQEQSECIYGRTLEERKKYCKFCSAICEARIEQEQPDGDLEKEYNEQWGGYTHDGLSATIDRVEFEQLARHFYELGLKARKEE